MKSACCLFLCMSSTSLIHVGGRRAVWLIQAGPERRTSLISHATESLNGSSSTGPTIDQPNHSRKQGVAQNVERLWKEYFTDLTQWWDDRAAKKNSKSPDFKHKVTRKALWLDGWSTPSWVKEELLVRSGGKSQPQMDNLICGTQDVACIDRVSSMTKRKYLDRVDAVNQQGISFSPNECCEILQMCSKMKDLVGGKQVHEHIKHSGLEQNSYVANHLVRMYAKCGRLKDARQVFDNLVKKDIFSWTSMIGIYAHHGDSEEAFKTFHGMVREGVQPNKVTYVCILNACCKPQALQWGKEIHRHTGQNRVHIDAGFHLLSDPKPLFQCRSTGVGEGGARSCHQSRVGIRCACRKCTCAHVCQEWQY